MYQSKIIRDKDRTKRNGEVFTPIELVSEMLDHIDPAFWSDSTKTILEPSAGSGNFLVAILERFMAGLEDIIPDPIERHKHIIENQIYAVELQQDNVDEAIERLGCAHLKHHIVCADALTYHYRFDEYDIKQPIFEWPE